MSGQEPRDVRKRAWIASALALVVFFVAWAERASSGQKHLEASDAASAQGDQVEAIVLARAAAEARCPFCSAPARGYERLQAIASQAEAQGDIPAALAAWRAARAAALGTTVIDPSTAMREKADAQIARLEHRVALSAETPTPAATEERLRATLAARTVPSGIVFALVALGAVLFLGGAMRFARAPTFRVAELAAAAAGGALAAAGVLVF